MCKTKKTAQPMINSCSAPKVVLSNGMRITCTHIPSLQGHLIMDIWATDLDGRFIAARTVRINKDQKDKADKIHYAMNELKLEIVAYIAGKVADKTNNNIKAMLDAMTKAYNELKVEKL